MYKRQVLVVVALVVVVVNAVSSSSSGSSSSYAVRIFEVQKQLNRTFGFCTVLYVGLLGYKTVSTGIFDAYAVRY